MICAKPFDVSDALLGVKVFLESIARRDILVALAVAHLGGAPAELEREPREEVLRLG